eukprot:415742-Pyramimonas_sp.AAC.1
MAEWRGASKAMVDSMAKEWPLRMRGKVQAILENKFKDVRATTIKSFRKDQRNIKTKYRLIEKSVYEDRFPGRIEQEKLTVKTKIIEG